jgi:superfamily II DNA or RNA helicase
MSKKTPDYLLFRKYKNEVLEPKPETRQILHIDGELTDAARLPRYQSDLDHNEWPKLKGYYNKKFKEIVSHRLNSTTGSSSNIDIKFSELRETISDLNHTLTSNGQRQSHSFVMSRPAEKVLLKRLRKHGYDTSALDIEYIEKGGSLYLLELSITSAQQQAVSDKNLLSVLTDEASGLAKLGERRARKVLNEPVIMYPLWENQREGLKRWLENDREGILEMATATGKTVAGIGAIGYICGDMPEMPEQSPDTKDADMMVVAHSNAILGQWAREISDKLGLKEPDLTDGVPDQISFDTGRVEFRTAQSLLPRYDRDLCEEYDLVIYDEVHHYSNLNGGYGEAIQRPNYRWAIGLSATIGDEGGKKRQRLQEILGDVVYNYDVEDARRDNIIPDFDWTVHPTALDPYELEEWEEATESIKDQFKYVRRERKTRDTLKKLSVPFTELEHLGDFIQAHKAAGLELSASDIPDSWDDLQAAIQSRSWIRHRSQPKIDSAVELASEYVSGGESGAKTIVFTMDIETAEEIGRRLEEVSDEVYVVHSKVASSSKKKDRIVRERIDEFEKGDQGVLVSPKLLDEGIDVPDAEVGINVAGTKTKLQLVQRMGRVLRRHADQEPHFHHFIAVPEKETYHEELDSKEYVQEINWVRELGEKIDQQPDIKDAHPNPDILERAEERGHELWADDLIQEFDVETVEGSVDLENILESVTLEAAEIIRSLSDTQRDISEDEWSELMEDLREKTDLGTDALQRIWWLFPLYRHDRKKLLSLMEEAVKTKEKEAQKEAVTTEGKSGTAEVKRDSASGENTEDSERTEDDDGVVSRILGYLNG